MKENINEHDMTKNMMKIMRGGYKSKLLVEIEDQDASLESDDQKDTLTPVKGDAVFKEELNKLMDTVDSSAQITLFKIYPKDRNVIIEGTLIEGESEGSGIRFKMVLKKREIETSMENVEFDDNISFILQKLKGYYQNWCNEWSRKITNEYNQNVD
jgi:hypothetical protein